MLNLLRAVSHDLRTPLTTIYTASSALRSKKNVLTEDQQDTMLKNIEEDSEWLVRMVENLLSVTKINNDEIKIAKTPVILDELVDSVMTKFLNRYPAQKVTLDIPEDVVVVSVDTILIEQVLMNLLENAVFHAKNMTCISVHIFSLGEKVIFEIADDGCGISEDRLQQIFSGTYDVKVSLIFLFGLIAMFLLSALFWGFLALLALGFLLWRFHRFLKWRRKTTLSLRDQLVILLPLLALALALTTPMLRCIV